MNGRTTASDRSVSLMFRRNGLVLDIELPAAPFIALSGPNGAGKTTVLRCLAGLEEDATVDWADNVPARIGYLPQRVMLYPAMSLADNIASSLRFVGGARSTATQRAAELLDLVDIGDLGRRRPHEVSGGQRQRAGLARAIAATPELLLLDEPFAAIDADSRAGVRDRIIEHIAASGARCIFATHDIADIEAAAAATVVIG